MKIDKLFDFHVLTGIVIGALVGLHYPTVIGDYKTLLVIAALVMGSKVVGVLK